MRESALGLLLDARSTWKRGPAVIALKQRARFSEMVAFARANSPYYHELYLDQPERIEDVTRLSVTKKTDLMARFDDWLVDRQVNIGKIRAFVDDPDRIGERFMGRYTVATTSGTTGIPGIFLMEARSLAVTNALAFRMLTAWLGARDLVRILGGRGRLSMVNATGGHFASAVAAARLGQRRGKRLQVIPVQEPLPEMVARLNRFAPVIVAAYASIGALLASEQEAGRLHIGPVLVTLSAEGLPAGEYDRIARAFNAKVRHSYAATECPFLSYSCEHGWLHVNSDWVVLEPVDAEYRPAPPGQESHTVLVSNLANRVQPILRYDLGDSVLQRPDPCPCGNPLPAIRVQGRAAEVLIFRTERGDPVSIAPLVFSALFNRTAGIELFQIVQTTSTKVRVRLRPVAGADPDGLWETVHTDISRLLAQHQLDGVAVERAEEPPVQSSGGKYRTVIPLP